jgi:hypothetical protein
VHDDRNRCDVNAVTAVGALCVCLRSACGDAGHSKHGGAFVGLRGPRAVQSTQGAPVARQDVSMPAEESAAQQDANTVIGAIVMQNAMLSGLQHPHPSMPPLPSVCLVPQQLSRYSEESVSCGHEDHTGLETGDKAVGT